MAVAAVALVAGVVALLMWLLAPTVLPVPARNPFGMGTREAAPTVSGLGAYILALQGRFFRNLQAAVSAVNGSGGLFALMTVGFAYGVFHAAGPGHGKAVIGAYLVASERALLKGLLLSLAAAIVQALVAIGIVGALAVALKATAATMSQATNAVEISSFAAIAAIGAIITWRKAGKFLEVVARSGDPAASSQVQACDHVHLPPPEVLERLTRWREMAGIALAAGIRPCAGAIVVLVFGLSQGLFAAGVAATFAMALGTALTTGTIATLAVFAKSLALRLAGGRGAGGEVVIATTELLASAFVVVLGLSLLLGLSALASSA